MNLLIDAQDIASISFGLVEGGAVVLEQTVCARPEEYLFALSKTLKQWGQSHDQIKEIFVVTGPGSFTASRVSTTIANALAFAKNIPIRALENPEHLPLKELDLCAAKTTASSVKPTYDRAVQITMSKKVRGDNADN